MRPLLQLTEQPEAVVARQADVEQHEADALAVASDVLELLSRLFRAAGLEVRNPDPPAGTRQDGAHRGLIVDDQDLAHGGLPSKRSASVLARHWVTPSSPLERKVQVRLGPSPGTVLQ